MSATRGSAFKTSTADADKGRAHWIQFARGPRYREGSGGGTLERRRKAGVGWGPPKTPVLLSMYMCSG